MKLKLIILLFMIICCRALAQDKLPAFLIVNTSGNYVRSSALPVNKSAILIYFQPDCEDCRQFTALLVKDDVIFRRYDQVIMITNSEFRSMRQFVADFKLNEKKNVIVGTEGWTSTVQRKLNITRFPFVTGYNKDKIQRWRLTNEGNASKLYDQLKRFSSRSKNDH
ncbi:MAG TPA: hypothetical protein VL442_09260 [Mucilaginibacter sp.]|nr:hypothetical protein [Mucilaginibacter sp.]